MRISRSHHEAHQRCPFLRYLTYHFGGKGIVRKKGRIELISGSLAHGSLADLLEWVKDHDTLPPAGLKREVFADRLGKFKEELVAKELYNEGEFLKWGALLEALVRAWLKVRLPVLLQDYRVVELEQEGIVRISDDVEWMTRLDGVVQKRDDRSVSALEFKTTGNIDSKVVESWHYDTQLMSHLLAIQDRFGGYAESTLLEMLYKGYQKEGRLYSPLVSGWFSPSTGEFDWKYERTNMLTGAVNRKGKGWDKFNVWERDFRQPKEMGRIEYWVENILDYEALREQLVNIEVRRNSEEMKEWLVQLEVQEGRVAKGLKLLEVAEELGGDTSRLLAEYFPKYKGKECKCDKYKKECGVFPVCFKEMDLENWEELFEIREPHHEGEFEEVENG